MKVVQTAQMAARLLSDAARKRLAKVLLPMSLAAGLELKQQPTLLEARQPVVEGKLRSKLTIANVSYPANDPIEDRWDFRDYDGKTFAAVMDGHGGWQAADFAQRELLATVGKELDNCSNVGVPGQVADAMARAYKRVDRAFLHSVKPAFEQGFGDVAKVGCCAITAAVLPSAVVVANAGDCRAVLGRIHSSSKAPIAVSESGLAEKLKGEISSRTLTIQPQAGEWSADIKRGYYYQHVALSRDHNARLPYEKERLALEHPGENDVVMCRPNDPNACYVKGRLQPTRVLGDGYLKHSEFNATGAYKGDPAIRQWGRHIKAPYTPPYVSSDPEVCVQPLYQSKTEKGDAIDSNSFLILACDGVWDVLNNDQAVAFVAGEIHAAGGPSKANQKQLEGIAERLKEFVLHKAAEEEGISLAQIKLLKPGSGGGNGRRSFHDDITCLIVYLGSNYKAGGSVVAPPGGGANKENAAAGGGAWYKW